MSVIGWPNNVNQVISAESTFSVGEGGFVEDQDSTGHQERYLTQTVSQKKFNVIMYFDYATKDKDGLSEYDRFERWFEFRHKRGVIPFEFPSISRFNIDSTSDYTYEYARYKITSPLQVSKSGLDMQVSMTWVEVYSGIQSIQNPPDPTLVSCFVDSKSIVAVMNVDAETPVLSQGRYEFSYSSDFTNYSPLTPISCYATGSKIIFNFSQLPVGSYKFKVRDTIKNQSVYTVATI